MLWDFYSIVFSCKHHACHITDFLSYAKFNCHKSSIFNVRLLRPSEHQMNIPPQM